MQTVIQYYSQYNEDSRLIKRRTGRLEFEATTSLVNAYLEPGSRILELGAGSGRYSVHYAEQGYSVTAVELTPALAAEIEEKKQAKGLDNLEIINADALSMPEWCDPFDIVLCFGPYYHLKSHADRNRCLSVCRKHLKPEGTMFLSYINKHFAISLYYSKGFALDRETLDSIQHNHTEFKNPGDPFLDITYLTEPDHVENELDSAGFTVVDHIATDGLHCLYNSRLEELSEEQWIALRDHHLANCRNRSIFGYSSHGLVATKRRIDTL